MDDIRSNQQEKKSSNSWILYLLLGLAVLGGGYFFWQNNENKKEALRLKELNHADSIRIVDLDAKYTAALDTMNQYRGLNAQLDSIIHVREGELRQARNRYIALVQQNKLHEEEYKKQIADLQNIQSSFQSQLDQVKAQNGLCIVSRDSLNKLVLAMRDSIVTLTDSNNVLFKLVTKYSLLQPTKITATGVHTKGSGKDSETNKASKVSKIKVCFDVPTNVVARAGDKTFYIRIMSSDGTTLTGSTPRTFTKAETNEEVAYSTSKTFTYNNRVVTNVCDYMQPSTDLTKGSYSVEIYQDGYLVGSQKFTLK